MPAKFNEKYKHISMIDPEYGYRLIPERIIIRNKEA